MDRPTDSPVADRGTRIQLLLYAVAAAGVPLAVQVTAGASATGLRVLALPALLVGVRCATKLALCVCSRTVRDRILGR